MLALTTASAIALTIAGGATSNNARAQSAAPTPPQAAQAPSVEEIVVTGSRIVRDGYEAPTPVTVVGVEQMQQSGFANLFDTVRQMPAFGLSSDGTRAAGNSVSSGSQGQNTYNLRNLGSTRTLSLLDGHRIVSSDLNGAVDTNNFPMSLVSRVDVVTGGASAAYGSDALAGVVNFILDKGFTGVKGEVSSGITTFGDDWTAKTNLTVGFPFADDRGHVLASYEWNWDPGVFPMSKREWNHDAWKILPNPAYTPTNGQPQYLVRDHVGLNNETPGGIISAGPLKGTAFAKDGTPFQFVYPSLIGGAYMAGGNAPYGDTTQYSQNVVTRSRIETFYFRPSYDVAENVNIYAQFIGGFAKTFGLSKLNDSPGTQVIKADNPFIPTTIVAQMQALKLTSFNMGSFFLDLPNLSSNFKRRNWSYALGADGKTDAFDTTWTWDVYAQYGLTRNNLKVQARNNVLFALATDAVRNAQGQIVCRVNQVTVTNPSCLPFDPFGYGVNDQNVVNYVMGYTWRLQENYEKLAEFSVNGEPFSSWAGPVSVAFGGGWRQERVRDDNAGPNPYDPVSLTRPFSAGNYLPTNGQYDVTEGYVETVVPLAKGETWAKSLDFNAAARFTGYTTSGYVTTWKLGVTYNPIDDVRFRVTRSRDIRAPNLGEEFATGTGGQSGGVLDPFNGNQAAPLFLTQTVGNTNLQPEKADTLGLGVVLQPKFLPGFSASIDYFDIDINGAIQSVNSQNTLNLCYAGQTALCANIQRNSAGVITLVTSRPTNYLSQVARGIDFEATYTMPLSSVIDSWDGNLTIRALATRNLEQSTNDGVNPVQDQVGCNTSSCTGTPYWKYFVNATYSLDPVTIGFTGRGVSAGNYGPSYNPVACTSGCPTSTLFQQTIDYNHIAGQWVFDANITFKFLHKAESNVDLEGFLTISDILNPDPPVVANINTEYWYRSNCLLYECLGRSFRGGIRFKY
jgi:outer membrane receptor protein involved in Fe transport